VGNVGPCLAICNGGRKDGFSPLDVTPAPCLDVTPSCQIKEGLASTQKQTRWLVWVCIRSDAPMIAELYIKKKTKLNYPRKIKLDYKLVPQLTNSKEK
jgi:hypothetical protein